MALEILHTADSHIGYQQYHSPEREQDFVDAFSRVITAAIDRSVDAVVHGGDLFHRSRPSIEALSTVVRELRRLRDENIPFYIIVGNHDGTRSMQWPQFFETLDLAVYLDDTATILDETVALYGLDHVGPGKRESLDYQFESSDVRFNVLVAHGLFDLFPHGDWDTSRLLTKSNIDFDVMLLGDDHKPQQERLQNTIVTYPGSTERTAADQREARGYNVIRVDDSLEVSHEKIATRPFEYVDLSLSKGDGLGEVMSAVEATSVPDGGVLIVTIEGEGGRFPTADVEDLGVDKGALVVKVNDRREHTDEEPEYADVSFSDPDDAVTERKAETDIGPIASELEELARDESVPESVLKDRAEEMTAEMVEDRAAEEFVPSPTDTSRDGNNGDGSEGPATDEGDEAGREGTSPEQASEQAGNEPESQTGESEDAEDSVGGPVESESAGQMTFGDIGGDDQ